MLNLTIQHIIHLTEKQRYALHEGIELVTVGVSVPVWFMNNVTSEPAKEIFCNYYLKNDKQEVPIKIRSDGYEICLPYRAGSSLDISDDEWRQLSNSNIDLLDDLYSRCIGEVSSVNLLNNKDGGCKYMAYREQNVLQKGEKRIQVTHFVKIADIEELINSL
jgi:hypothetical protein